MPDESYAFLDRKCPRCNGEGTLRSALPVTLCPLCRGTGIVGSYEPVPDMPKLNPTPFSKILRSTRENRKISLRNLALLLGFTPSRLSGIEVGLYAPTPDEEKKIREYLEGEYHA